MFPTYKPFILFTYTVIIARKEQGFFIFSVFFCMYDPLVSSRHFKIGIMLTVVNYFVVSCSYNNPKTYLDCLLSLWSYHHYSLRVRSVFPGTLFNIWFHCCLPVKTACV